MVAELCSSEQIFERICEQIADVHVPQVVEQVLEAPKISSQDQNLLGTVDQIPNVLASEMVEQLVKLPKTVSENRIQERTVEHIAADFPVLQVAEELVEVSEVFPKDMIQQRFAEQTIDTPGISLAEKIVEGPVTQTQGKTQQVVNTSVQHNVNTLEVEKHITQEKINQVTRHVETPLLQIVKKTCEVPELQFINKAVNTHVVAQRQIRMNRKVHKTIEVPQLQHTDQVVDVPVVMVAQVPHMRVVTETVEIPQSLFVEKTVMIPEIQTVQGPRTSESLSGEITVAGKMDHEIVVRGVAQDIQMDSFIDDLGSIVSKGLSHHDCGRPFHVDSTSGSMHQQHTPGQVEEEREEEDGRKRTT